MLNTDDLAAMRANAAAIRGDREAAIRLFDRSGQQRMDQTVRLDYMTDSNSTRRRQTPQGESVTIDVLVKGARDMEVEAGDTFVIDSIAYEVVFVRPDRTVETVAEAKAMR